MSISFKGAWALNRGSKSGRGHFGRPGKLGRQDDIVGRAKEAALDVLRHNARGPCAGLPRTAGWGYPEPYTRDWMISALGVLVSNDRPLIQALGRVLKALARHQTAGGHIPSLAHRADDVGASDTTPLFLIAVALYRRTTGDREFLAPAVRKALAWMRCQSPDDLILVAQQPTSDWRDEQWVMGYGLYVNTLVHTHLRLHGLRKEAARLAALVHLFAVSGQDGQRHVHEGLAVKNKPYYALWSYKIYSSERFDLLGNSLAILSGVASRARANQMVRWIEAECEVMRQRGILNSFSLRSGGRETRRRRPLPPCLFPFIQPVDPDWRPRYQRFNNPGQYHNGGIWPFVCGFYVAALVAAGRMQLARRRLNDLTELVTPARDHDVPFGFNEWFDATTGQPRGEDWQTWSAAMYYYAATCVERGRTPFFDQVRGRTWK